MILYERESGKMNHCTECNKFCPIYMLKDKIWFGELNMNQEDNLCATCLIKKLDRPLAYSDFKKAPVCNQLYLAILKQ
jgi:hypothetical protein